jgi:hypothetical protein
MKGVVIEANLGGHCTLALIGLPHVSLSTFISSSGLVTSFVTRMRGPHQLRQRIQAFDLIFRHYFDLRLPLVKFDYAGDADDFPLEGVDPQVSRHFGTGCNESSKDLIRIFSSEIYKRGPEWADRDGDNQTAHFDVFTNVLNGFRIFDYRQFARLYWDKAEQQTENRKEWTHVGADYSLELKSACTTHEHFACHLDHLHFPAFS